MSRSRSSRSCASSAASMRAGITRMVSAAGAIRAGSATPVAAPRGALGLALPLGLGGVRGARGGRGGGARPRSLPWLGQRGERGAVLVEVLRALIVQPRPYLRGHRRAEHVEDLVPPVAEPPQPL